MHLLSPCTICTKCLFWYAAMTLLGIKRAPCLQGHVYSLMGGVVDERLALLHLGYKHMQGLDGFPKDQDMAYGYYANVAKQTSIDLNNVQDMEVRAPSLSSLYTSET